MNATKERSESCEPASIASQTSSQSTASNDSVTANVPLMQPQEREGKSASSPLLAPTVESSLRHSPATIENIAAEDVQDSQVELLAQRVSDAGNLCERCTTAIARSLASHSHKIDHQYQPGPGFICERNAQILSRSLALFAESLGNTDTIPTTASLNLLFGYVRHAIATSIPTSETGNEPDQTTRLFYSSKASRSERNKGLDGMPERATAEGWTSIQDARPHMGEDYKYPHKPAANHHPTVKPLDLMQWLVRLVTPRGGTVLDPFAGSGTTLIAADREGFDAIGIEQSAEYAEIARRRCIGDAPLFANVAAD